MPRVRRIAKRRYSSYGPQHIRQLKTGHDFFGDAFGSDQRLNGKVDIEAMHEAWEQLGDEILAEWIMENPGSRPFAWWLFSAPEPRRQRIDGGVHPFDNPERIKAIEKSTEQHPNGICARKGYKLIYGVPALCVVADDSEAEFESEREYLIRLSLLTESEIEARGQR